MNFLIEFFLSKLKAPSFLLMCCTVTVHCETEPSANFVKVVRQQICNMKRYPVAQGWC